MSDPILIGIGAGFLIGVFGLFATVFLGGERDNEPRAAARPSGPESAPVAPAQPDQARNESPDETQSPLCPVVPTAAQDDASACIEDADEAEYAAEDAKLCPPDESERARKIPYASGLVAPVELWVGDTRIVVKDGTRTHARFRTYADSLLTALKEARQETR